MQTIVPEGVLGHVLEDATGVAMGVLAHAKADAARIAKMTARPSAYHLASQTVQKTAVERASFHAFLVVANLAICDAPYLHHDTPQNFSEGSAAVHSSQG